MCAVDLLKAAVEGREDIISEYWAELEADTEVNDEVAKLLDWMEDQAMVIKELYGGYVVMVGAVVVAMGTRAECRAWLRKAVAQMMNVLETVWQYMYINSALETICWWGWGMCFLWMVRNLFNDQKRI